MPRQRDTAFEAGLKLGRRAAAAGRMAALLTGFMALGFAVELIRGGWPLAAFGIPALVTAAALFVAARHMK